MAERVKLRALTEEEREALERMSRSRTVESRQAERIKIVRMASQGCGMTEIAKKVGVTRPRVLDWIKRFYVHGMAGWTTCPAVDVQPHTVWRRYQQ